MRNVLRAVLVALACGASALAQDDLTVGWAKHADGPVSFRRPAGWQVTSTTLFTEETAGVDHRFVSVAAPDSSVRVVIGVMEKVRPDPDDSATRTADDLLFALVPRDTPALEQVLRGTVITFDTMECADGPVQAARVSVPGVDGARARSAHGFTRFAGPVGVSCWVFTEALTPEPGELVAARVPEGGDSRERARSITLAYQLVRTIHLSSPRR